VVNNTGSFLRERCISSVMSKFELFDRTATGKTT